MTDVYQSFLTDDAKLTVLLQERPAVVSFHFGLPDRERIDALHAADILLIATATSLEEGKAIAAPASMPWSPRVMERVGTAACSIRAATMIGWAPWR